MKKEAFLRIFKNWKKIKCQILYRFDCIKYFKILYAEKYIFIHTQEKIVTEQQVYRFHRTKIHQMPLEVLFLLAFTWSKVYF